MAESLNAFSLTRKSRTLSIAVTRSASFKPCSIAQVSAISTVKVTSVTLIDFTSHLLALAPIRSTNPPNVPKPPGPVEPWVSRLAPISEGRQLSLAERPTTALVERSNHIRKSDKVSFAHAHLA